MIPITVVIPLYNKAPYIERALDSVFMQIYRDFEIIVVDDGSTDGGGELVLRYVDPRMRLVRQANLGVSAARNRGVEEALSDWVAFLDADDEYLPGFLTQISAAITEYGSVVTAVFTNIYNNRDAKPWLVTRETAPVYVDYFRFAVAHSGRGMIPSSTVVRKAVFERIGLFPIGVPLGEDIDMWFRLACISLVCYIPQVLSVYHNEASTSAKTTSGARRTPLFPECVHTYRKWLKRGLIPQSKRKSALAYTNLMLLQYAKELAEVGLRSEARHVLTKECRFFSCPLYRYLFIFVRSFFSTGDVLRLRSLLRFFSDSRR